MRRVYTTGPKPRPAVQDALLQIRATRKALGPELIARLRVLVRDFDPESLSPQPPAPTPPAPAFEPVDRRNTLSVVMKFLQMNPGNRDLQSRIRAMLAETDLG